MKRLILVSLVILLLVGTSSICQAEPSPAVRYLIDTPVSMLDFGICNIGIPANFTMGQKIYGTAFGLFANEIENIKNRLREIQKTKTEEGQDKTPIVIEPVCCLELLRKYL